MLLFYIILCADNELIIQFACTLLCDNSKIYVQKKKNEHVMLEYRFINDLSTNKMKEASFLCYRE